MTDDDSVLLDNSIRHWKKDILPLANSDDWSTADYPIGPNDCPLCEKRLKNFCIGCPVQLKSGIYGCLRTPYVAVVVALDKGDIEQQKFIELINEEIKFLEDLRQSPDRHFFT